MSQAFCPPNLFPVRTMPSSLNHQLVFANTLQCRAGCCTRTPASAAALGSIGCARSVFALSHQTVQSRLLHKDPSKRMSVSQGLRHPWIVEENAEVPLSAGRWNSGALCRAG